MFYVVNIDLCEKIGNTDLHYVIPIHFIKHQVYILQKFQFLKLYDAPADLLLVNFKCWFGEIKRFDLWESTPLN